MPTRAPPSPLGTATRPSRSRGGSASDSPFTHTVEGAIQRTGKAATGTTITPRLRADCDIDLITIVDRAAKR